MKNHAVLNGPSITPVVANRPGNVKRYGTRASAAKPYPIAILVIAIGYGFAALALVPYLFTFPGLFATTGVIDGPLSTAWFFILWRAGFPTFVIGYAVLKDADPT